MKNYDVLVERRSGSFRALIPTLPNIVVAGASRDEASTNAKAAAQRYLSEVEVATVQLAERPVWERGPSAAVERELAIAAELNAPNTEIRPGSLESVRRAAADCCFNPASEMFQPYEAELAAERERQRGEAEREAAATASE